MLFVVNVVVSHVEMNGNELACSGCLNEVSKSEIPFHTMLEVR